MGLQELFAFTADVIQPLVDGMLGLTCALACARGPRLCFVSCKLTVGSPVPRLQATTST